MCTILWFCFCFYIDFYRFIPVRNWKKNKNNQLRASMSMYNLSMLANTTLIYSITHPIITSTNERTSWIYHGYSCIYQNINRGMTGWLYSCYFKVLISRNWKLNQDRFCQRPNRSPSQGPNIWPSVMNEVSVIGSVWWD